MTGITTEQLQKEKTFPEVYECFVEFIGDSDSVFCVWGMSDIKELFKNVEYHSLDTESLPKRYINLQPYVSKYFGLPAKICSDWKMPSKLFIFLLYTAFMMHFLIPAILLRY